MKKKCSQLIALLLICMMVLFSAGCGTKQSAGAEELIKYQTSWYQYFDTASTMIGFASSKEEFDEAAKIVEDTLAKYHKLYDIYYAYTDVVNLKNINEQAVHEPVLVKDEILDLLAFGKDMYEKTNGMCNIAMGAVLTIWHTYRETGTSIPTMDELEKAATHCSIDDLIIDTENKTVYLADPEMSVDVGAVAKGYATQRAADALRQAGFTGYVLSIGGNIATLGVKADGSTWTVGVQDPDENSMLGYVMALGITDEALVTSGTYQRYYELDGVRYHHIIDPDTLFPKNEFLSVSILTADSGYADALSTAVFNMPLEVGQAFIEGLENVEACWILSDETIVESSGFNAYVTIPPTK